MSDRASSPAIHSPMKTPPSDGSLSFRTKLGYGLGNFACMIGKQAPKQLSLPVYNVALGVDPSGVSTVLALGRVWDAVTDPLVGHWSDRVSTRWGRRKPFMLLGAVLTGLFFAAMWMIPRGLGPSAYLAYYAVTSFLFYLALTIFSVPWYALGYELAKTYDERTSLMAYPAVIGPLAQILVGWLYALTQLSFFSDTLDGVRWVGAGAGVLLLVFGLMPVLLVREDALPPAPVKAKAAKAKGPGFVSGVRAAFRNRPFRALTLAFTAILIGSSLVFGLGFYINTYYLFNGDTRAAGVLLGWMSTVTLVTTMVFTPLAARLAGRFGKKEVFMAGICWAIARMVAQWFLLTPEMPYLMLVNAVLLGVESAAIYMLCHAMIADVCDLDEYENGTRREGLFGAIYAWVYKTGLAMAFAASGYVLVLIGFDRELGGAQTPHTLTAMKIVFCALPLVMYAAALAAMRGYDLDKTRCEAMRGEMARRKTAGA